jgi:GNAT superfamily N-acetyltransferase
MIFREASITDISQIQIVRHTVKENVLSNPALVTDKDCEEYLMVKGKGWVCEDDNQLIGFAIVDLQDHNVWALFLRPEYEGKGIGKKLHNLMLDWYFSQTKETLWLGTAFNTRAEKFYRMQGWQEAGMHGTKETKFEMTYGDWQAKNKNEMNEVL